MLGPWYGNCCLRDVSLRSALSFALVVLLTASTLGAAEEESTRAVRCPAYAEHVRAAKTYLAHSDRANAAAELRLAEDALRECDLDDEEETALAAWTRAAWTRPSLR
jgi:hypothetical protein